MKRIKNAILSKLACAALAVTTALPVLCDGDVFSTAETAMGNVKDKMVSFAKAAFPVGLILCAISLIFTRDSKKVRVEVGILIAIILGYAAVLAIDAGLFESTVETVVGLG